MAKERRKKKKKKKNAGKYFLRLYLRKLKNAATH